MRIGMVGLGRMGANMTLRLTRDHHEVVGFDRNPDVTAAAAAADGVMAADSLDDLVARLTPPRVVWVMVPAGAPTGETLEELRRLLDSGDTIVDGGNSRYSDSIARAQEASTYGLTLLDVGTSGGTHGLSEGYCLMVGGDRRAFERVEPVFASLAAAGGYAHVGPSGAGHFTKMVHNGIEYALMQAYGEGFELLDDSDLELDTAQIAELWRNGSVIRSWLLDLVASALARDHRLEDVAPWIEDSGEGRWTLRYAIDRAVPVPTIATALFARFASRQDVSFAGKLIAALRKEFGGHATRKPS
ncbi:MAG TPA: decarboxylating 6-phosphogluconate dehydrogenase [Actinomycetota bacterium]|nr:decarboxylating 6-phosphogluconate dehydrogenase [Actinomycetota bacterium]